MAKYELGILGGMGPWATAKALEKIVLLTEAKSDADHVPIIVSCNARIPDRTRAIVAGGESPVPAMLDNLRFLESGGVRVNVLPCNTAHYFYDELAREAKVPLVNMVRDTMHYAQRKYPGKKVCLLATQGTLDGKVYEKYAAGETQFAMLDEKGRQTVMDIIYGIKSGQSLDGSLRDLLALMRGMGAQDKVFILACTELSLMADALAAYPDLQFVDAAEVMAASALMYLNVKLRRDRLQLDLDVLEEVRTSPGV